MQLTGIHHLTAITADPAGNHDFYTRVLGLRMVKKTVNQDDVSAYHLFYADGKGSPGSDITFFDWPMPPASHGRQSISRTAFRVPPDSLVWWSDRIGGEGVATSPIVERGGRRTFEFADPEGQRLAMVADEPSDDDHVWTKSPVPAEHQIVGLGPITLTLGELWPTERVLTGVLNMQKVDSFAAASDTDTEIHVFRMGEGGPAAELHLSIEPGLAPPRGRVRAACITSRSAFPMPSMKPGPSVWSPRACPPAARSTASTSRASISGNPAACCSKSRPTGRALLQTSRSTASAKDWRCRRFWRAAAPKSRRG